MLKATGRAVDGVEVEPRHWWLALKSRVDGLSWCGRSVHLSRPGKTKLVGWDDIEIEGRGARAIEVVVATEVDCAGRE